MIGTVATAIAIVQIIQKQNQYKGIQDGAYLVGFGMVGLFSSGMPFNIQTTFNHSNPKFSPHSSKTLNFRLNIVKEFGQSAILNLRPMPVWYSDEIKKG